MPRNTEVKKMTTLETGGIKYGLYKVIKLCIYLDSPKTMTMETDIYEPESKKTRKYHGLKLEDNKVIFWLSSDKIDYNAKTKGYNILSRKSDGELKYPVVEKIFKWMFGNVRNNSSFVALNSKVYTQKSTQWGMRYDFEVSLADSTFYAREGSVDEKYPTYSQDDKIVEAYFNEDDLYPEAYAKTNYDISAEKMKLLIEERNISLTEKNYASMKKDYPQLLSAFVSVNFSDFIKNDLSLETTGEDMLALLDCDELNSKQKAQLLSADFAVWKTMTDTASLAKIGKAMIKIRFSENCIIPINSIIGSMENIADKMDILELQHGNMKSEDVARIVAGLGAEHAALIERKGRCPKIERTPENEKLAKVLEAKRLVSSFAIKENKIEIHQKKK